MPAAAPPPVRTHPLTGLILAGGLGRRMAQGRAEADPPKPLVMLEGRPLIAHVIARLRPQVDTLLINANDHLPAYGAFALPVLPDSLSGHPGPLAGVLAGLEHLAATGGLGPLLTAPADTPFLPPDLAARLLRRHEQTGGVVHAASAGRSHFVVAIWPQAARPVLAAALAAGDRRVGLLLQRLDAVAEEWEAGQGDPFFNVNTLEELEIAAFRRSARQ